jgi:hypothetical protein
VALKYFNVLSGISAGNITINAANNTVVANEFVGNIVGDSGTLTDLEVTGNITTGIGTGGTISGANLLSANFLEGTLISSSQPNITSVGTLTGLNINGNIVAVNITANTGVFTGNGSALTALNGSNITTGTIAAARVATLNQNTTGSAATVTTAAQPNITSVGNLTTLTVTGNTFLSTTSGNVGIGTITPDYKLEVNGSFAATTKSFVIDHPAKPGMKLRYGSLEGPENGVYIRGRLQGTNKIELPDYWSELVDEDTVTVSLTPIGNHQKLYVKEINKSEIVVVGNDNLFSKDIDCFYFILAERKDVDKLIVEY